MRLIHRFKALAIYWDGAEYYLHVAGVLKARGSAETIKLMFNHWVNNYDTLQESYL